MNNRTIEPLKDMNLDVLKMLIQSACADGELTNEKRQHLAKKAKEARVNLSDLDFLIKNELNKVKKDKQKISFNASKNNKSGFETYNKSGFISTGNITDNVTEKDDFTNISEYNTSGSMSSILKAKYYGKWVAIKAIKPEFKDNKKFKELFNKEFANTFDLEHENIVRVYGKTKNEKDPYYFMEFVDGNELTKLIGNEGVRSGSLVKKIANEILSALDYSHKKQIFHRDLKPENILITHKGNNTKLIDFGLAIADNYEDDLQKAGTPAYMPPEQKENAQTADGKSDIYSFGIILIQMLTGKLKYTNAVDSRSTKISKIIKKCIAENPRNRYSAASDIIFDLKGITLLDLKFDMRLSVNKVDFGQININEEKIAEIKIINRGIGSLNWEITSKLPNFITTEKNENILHIKLKAQKSVNFNENITITSNGGNLNLKIIGKVIEQAKIEIDRKSIDFKTQIDRKIEFSKRIEISNSGSGKLVWKVKEYPKWLICTPSKNHIYIEYNPTKVNSLKGNIIIESNGGQKIIPISITVSRGDNPVIDISPTQIHFNNVHIGELKEAIIDIENIGGGKLDWHVSKSSKWLSVSKLKSSLKINFVPTRLGNFAGNIVVKSNASDINVTISASVVEKFNLLKTIKKPAIIFAAVIALAFLLYSIPYKNFINNNEKETAVIEEVIEEKAEETKNISENKLEETTPEIVNSENTVWSEILKQDDQVAYYKFLKKFPENENYSKAYRLFNLSDTTLCLNYNDNENEFITEDIMLVVKNKTVKGRLLGNSSITDSLWMADLIGTRKNDTLLINQTNFSGFKTKFILIIENGFANKINAKAEIKEYKIEKCKK